MCDWHLMRGLTEADDDITAVVGAAGAIGGEMYHRTSSNEAQWRPMSEV